MDNAPNYLVGCIIQKRSKTTGPMTSPKAPSLQVVSEDHFNVFSDKGEKISTVCLQFSGNKKAKESDEDTNDTPPPAKRGRKPKDATASAASTPNPKESEPTNITSTPKSPRGRKRKTEEKSNEELKRPEESGMTPQMFVYIFQLSIVYTVYLHRSTQT